MPVRWRISSAALAKAPKRRCFDAAVAAALAGLVILPGAAGVADIDDSPLDPLRSFIFRRRLEVGGSNGGDGA